MTIVDIDALIADKPMPPERIYGWLDTQMSIARHYGGLKYQGHSYTIAPNEDGQPLVRDDVLRREAKERTEKRRKAREQAKKTQGELL